MAGFLIMALKIRRRLPHHQLLALLPTVLVRRLLYKYLDTNCYYWHPFTTIKENNECKVGSPTLRSKGANINVGFAERTPTYHLSVTSVIIRCPLDFFVYFTFDCFITSVRYKTCAMPKIVNYDLYRKESSLESRFRHPHQPSTANSKPINIT